MDWLCEGEHVGSDFLQGCGLEKFKNGFLKVKKTPLNGESVTESDRECPSNFK